MFGGVRGSQLFATCEGMEGIGLLCSEKRNRSEWGSRSCGRFGVEKPFFEGDSSATWEPAWPNRGPKFSRFPSASTVSSDAKRLSLRFFPGCCGTALMKGEFWSMGPERFWYSKSIGVVVSRFHDMLLSKE